MELIFENVCKSYGNKKVIEDFNIKFTEGVYGILGPNGAGKSTLMSLLTDNIDRTAGKIMYDGKDILELSGKFRALVGYMPQQQGMYETFSGKQFMWYMASLKGLKRKDAKKQIDELVELVGLGNDIHRKIGEYSGGMKQRIMLAQAMLGNPRVLILDEPTAGLDPEERIRIRNYISEMSKDKIVMLATHVVSDIECTATQVVMIKGGQLIGMDTPENLIKTVQGKVAEVVCGQEELAKLQKTYKIGNVSQCEEGVMLRMVGDNLPEEFERIDRGVNLEDVYLYYLEDDKGRKNN